MEKTRAGTPKEAVQMGTTPSQKQNVPEGKASHGKKKRVTDAPKKPTMTTRSMQKEREKNWNLCDSVERLPGLSKILIQAINLSKSAKGLSFTELKRALRTKGYNVAKHCPSIKRQLKSLASKGALLRMTHKAGCSFFVIRKHQGEEVTAQASEKTARTKKTGAERTHSRRASEKMKGVTQQAKSSGLKAAKATKKAQSLNRKWKPGAKQPRQPPSQSSSAKTLRRPIKQAVSTIKTCNTSAAESVPSTKRPCYSSGKSASYRKRDPRSTAANANTAKKSESPLGKAASKRSRGSRNGEAASAKRLRSPYSHTALNVKASKYSRNKIPSSGKTESKPRRKASFPPPGHNSRVTSNAKTPGRK